MTNHRDESDGPPELSGHELTELRALEDALGNLPSEARVPDHLWFAIRERMGVPEKDVVELDAWRTPGPRRFSVSLGQLVAAGVALVFLSGGSVWLTLSAAPDVTGPSAVPVLGMRGAVVAASDQGSVPATTIQDYQNAVAELEMILEEGRQVLGHETIQTIQESLVIIDDAIDEARDALAGDPGSDVLNRLLVRNMWKKIEILKQTAVAIRARST